MKTLYSVLYYDQTPNYVTKKKKKKNKLNKTTNTSVDTRDSAVKSIQCFDRTIDRRWEEQEERDCVKYRYIKRERDRKIEREWGKERGVGERLNERMC